MAGNHAGSWQLFVDVVSTFYLKYQFVKKTFNDLPTFPVCDFWSKRAYIQIILLNAI